MTLKRVLECLPAISRIARSRDPIKRQKLLKEAKDCIFFAISEISLNILKGTIPLNTYHKKKLDRHKDIIRRIASKDTKFPARKRIIIQSGGFLPSLLIPAVTVLSEVIANKILK